MTPPEFLITRPLSMKFSSFTFFSRISMTCDILDIDGKSQQIHRGFKKSKIVALERILLKCFLKLLPICRITYTIFSFLAQDCEMSKLTLLFSFTLYEKYFCD